MHDNGILGLPYVPAFIGVYILGRLIKEDDQSDPETDPTLSGKETNE